jgi:hypothetical protein
MIVFWSTLALCTSILVQYVLEIHHCTIVLCSIVVLALPIIVVWPTRYPTTYIAAQSGAHLNKQYQHMW